MAAAAIGSVSDPTLVTKIICLVLFAAISLCCGLLPLVLSRVASCWKRQQQHERARRRLSARLEVLVSCVLCLGGGVLLGTVFTHMMPEIRHVFTQIESAGLLPGMQTPAGEIFICIGFFLVYLVEELVHAFVAGRNRKKKDDSLPLTTMHAETSPSPAPDEGEEAATIQVHGDREAMAWNAKLYKSAVPTSAPAPAAANSHVKGSNHEHNSGGHNHGSAIATLHAFRAYVVVIALSIHSVFEGFAVAFETRSRDVWLLFAAIATHKAIVSFCLGEQLLATKRSVCFTVTNVLLLAAASPLGVALGLLVEQLDTQESSRLVTTGILQGLAAGTILYVVFFEILGPERQKHSHGLLKFFTVVAGFCLILLVHSSSGHSHGAPQQWNNGHPTHHGHGTAHAGHDEDHHGPLFESDYLARVQNESGHVLDTVRYIQSFRKQETDDVSRQAIMDNMRNVVQEVTGGYAGSESHDTHHGEHHGFGEEGHNRIKPGEAPGSFDTTHVSSSGSDKKTADNDEKVSFHDDHDDHGHIHDVGFRPSLNQVGNEEFAVDNGNREHSLMEGESPDSEAHHHNHDHFMRTVKDLAESLSDVDPSAVDKTVKLMDRLDLIASQSTKPHHVEDHEHEEAESHHVPEINHDHHMHHSASGHDSEHSTAFQRGPDHSIGPEEGHTERNLLYADHADHVHFVLQDTTTYPEPSASTDPVPEYISADTQKELQRLTEVRFHDAADSTSTPASVLADMTSRTDVTDASPGAQSRSP